MSLIAALVVGAPALAQGQTGRISGTVTAAEGGVPLGSVQVHVIGTSAGAMTRDDGRYTIAVQPGTYRLRATRVGYTPDTVANVVVTAGGEATANFAMRGAATVLSGVVVVGYGEQEQRDVTGSVAAVTPEEFNTGRIVSPQELIRAKVPGVQVVDNNEPGGKLQIRVRGGTSVNASNEPLYVVDGVPLVVGGGGSVTPDPGNQVGGRNPLNFLNPNDIENITVLKDASSTAIYGSRGANGVVLITTRSGATGPQLTYTGTYSGSKPVGGPDLVSAEQFRAAVQTYAPTNVAGLGSANTDWYGALERNAAGMEHNLSVGGRRQELNYRLGLGYLDQEGILIGSRTQRVSASLNYDDRFLKDNRLTLRAHLKGARNKDWFTPASVLGNAVSFAPTSPIHTSDGAFYEYRDPANGNLISLAPNNPVAEIALTQLQGISLRSVGNVEAEYAIPFLSGLTATVRAGYDVVRADSTIFQPTTLTSQLKAPSNPGVYNRNSGNQQNTVLDAYATYRRALDWLGSKVDVTGGYSTERFHGEYPAQNAIGLATNLLGLSGIPTANEAVPFLNVDEYRLVSGFGRANWSLLDRYLFTATVRRDGSSKFATGQQYGTFPSAAFAWRVVDEPMLKDRLPLSDLKLRVSWGKNGNQAVGNYIPYTSYRLGTNTAQAQLGGNFISTIRPSASDPNLQWEKTTSTNVGLDYGFMQGRISGSLDFYTKTTDDLLFSVPTAGGTALSNFLTTNIGSVRNNGFEFAIDARVIEGGKRDFTWDANFNVSHNTNELLSIDRPGVSIIQVGAIAGGVGTNVQVLQPGQPVNSFYVYQHKMKNGKPIYEDVNGDDVINDLDLYVDRNDDGIINTADLRPYKDPAPKWIYGFTSNFTWRGFDARTTIRAYTGNYVYNNVASNQGHYSNLTSANAPTNLEASVLRTQFVNAQPLSDVYVEDASFIRMDNLTIGYTFERLANVSSARIFGTIQNVGTSTDYTGIDPTAGVNGIDNNIYPRSRTFLGGLTLSF